MVADVAGWLGFWVNQVTREGDVRAGVTVQSILGVLLYEQPHGVHFLQTDQHTLALDLPPYPAVVIISHGLHLVPVLHQNHREQLFRELPHGEGEIICPGDAAAEVAAVWVEVLSNVDHELVEGHSSLLAPHHAAGSSGRESRAEVRCSQRELKGPNSSRGEDHE